MIQSETNDDSLISVNFFCTRVQVTNISIEVICTHNPLPAGVIKRRYKISKLNRFSLRGKKIIKKKKTIVVVSTVSTIVLQIKDKEKIDK